jgi:hypothetical protein
MASASTLTTNFNLLSPTGFKLVIDKTKYANVEYFVTTFSIPEIALGETSSPFRGGISYSPGERAQYGAMNIRFAIDEDMKNYREIHDWITGNITAGTLSYSDMILTVLSSHNNVNKQFQFISAFPTNLSGVEFTTQAQDVEYLQADVTFRYDRFAIL